MSHTVCKHCCFVGGGAESVVVEAEGHSTRKHTTES